jgi:hypothetical protein
VRVPEDEVDAFEEHYFACAACAGVFEKTAESVRAAVALVCWNMDEHGIPARMLSGDES